MQEIQNRLMEYKDEKNAAFQIKLTPGVDPSTFLGVRMPDARKLAKELRKESPELCDAFLEELPHTYYDEYILHGILLSEVRDYDRCIAAIEAFLPYIDNWAVCDTLSPKIFKKHRAELLEKIREWAASDATYTCRFGMEMLMSFYLDEAFDPEYLEIPAAVRSEEYYVNMMTAWFFATALAKQWEATIPYIEEQRLDVWTHNKTIQKARESFRITDEQKEYLKKLKK